MRHNEIGGYLQLETSNFELYHQNGICLNSARNCLKYIIRAFNIKEIALPYYTCPVIYEAVKEENTQIIPYELNDSLLIDTELKKDTFILYTNYFGISGKNTEYLEKIYPNLIVDNAQAFYYPKRGIASFYSPRKFFGVPDGGILLSDKKLNYEFEKSYSYNRCSHLLKRFDLGAQSGYGDFKENDKTLSQEPVKTMSDLTLALMKNINHDYVKNKRINNFNFLHNKLSELNQIKISLSNDDIPLCYPFRTNQKNLRQKLIENKIYTAKYWPKDNNYAMSTKHCADLAESIMALPIDQRYDTQDMERILEIIFS